MCCYSVLTAYRLLPAAVILNALLCLCGYLPGAVHAVYYLVTYEVGDLVKTSVVIYI